MTLAQVIEVSISAQAAPADLWPKAASVIYNSSGFAGLLCAQNVGDKDWRQT
jgi:hypothetical protein